ncbi:MAG: nickel pincer cofactor biosynthesis protein LarC [Pirellulales bacterium]
MRIAYLDCLSGISGDMMLGALVDAGVDLAAIQAGIDSLALPSCRLVATEVKRHGFRATHITVEHEPEHAHRHLHHIADKIDASTLTDRQKDLAKRIFTRLGEAEAKVHGTTIRKVHFHEVGAVDSIADIVGSAIGWELLGVDRVLCSPVPTGGGFIEIAHGRVSVPAPATAELLTGIPLADSIVQAELTTPTGAAIVATLAESFGPLPAMAIEKIGFGAGTRELTEQPNVLRLLVGATTDVAGDSTSGLASGAATTGGGVMSETVTMFETNVDDITGEAIGYCIERLWQAGALDVTTTAIAMKKNRPGVALSVMCRAADADKIETVLFRETTTLGVRRSEVRRRVLARRKTQIQTAYGPIDGVVADLPGGGEKFSPEYESCRKAAAQHGVSLGEIWKSIGR